MREICLFALLNEDETAAAAFRKEGSRRSGTYTAQRNIRSQIA
jgi:hypothetical protein